MKGDKLLGLTVCLTTDARKKIIKLLADYWRKTYEPI
jgi:hypothetical protein